MPLFHSKQAEQECPADSASVPDKHQVQLAAKRILMSIPWQHGAAVCLTGVAVVLYTNGVHVLYTATGCNMKRST